MTKGMLASATAYAALMALFVGGSAAAQTPEEAAPASGSTAAVASADAAQDEANTIGEIVVTARRTSENLQTTPVAVTAVSGAALEQAQVSSSTDLQRTAPSLVVGSGAPSSSGFVYVSIRGQGNLNPGTANDPAVGTYVDGVYIPRPSQGNTTLDDMQRVEILRGPQGTLFGRNTTGGALNIITNDPTGLLEGSVRGEIGNYNAKSAALILNVPLRGEELAARINYRYDTHDGYSRNAIRNRDQADLESHLVRGKLKFAPDGSAFDMTLSGDYNRITDKGQANRLVAVDPNATFATAVFQSALAPQFGPAASLIDLSGVYSSITPYLLTKSNWYDGFGTGFNPAGVPNGDRAPFDTLEAWGVSATMNYDADVVNFKSITAYRYSNSEGLIDIDASPVDILTTHSGYQSKQFSQEFQVTGDISENFNYIAGLYYSRETGYEFSDFQTFGFLNSYLEGFVEQLQGLPAGTLAGTFGAPAEAQNNAPHIKNISTGAFVQGYYKFNDKLRLAAGLRWTWDKRNVVIENINNLAFDPDATLPTGASNCAVAADLVDVAGVCRQTNKAKFDYPAYTIGLDYQATEDLFLYAKHSRASKAGGWNLRVGNAFLPAFDPEKALDVEVGAKYQAPNRRFRLNTALFHTWTSDVQRNANAVIQTSNGPTSTQYLRNAGKTRIYGAEFEAVLLPWEGMELTGNLALLRGRYVDGTYFDDLGGGVIVDRSDEPLPQLPRTQFALGATQTFPMAVGDLSAHLDYAYVSSQNFSPITAPAGASAAVLAQYAIQNSAQRIKGYGLLNARLGLELADSNVEIYAYGRNILGKKYLTGTFANSYAGPLGFAAGFVGEPATYGVGAKYSF